MRNGYSKGSVANVTKPTTTKKSVEEIAKEVLAGKWGNGTERKNKLISAGYDYNKENHNWDSSMKTTIFVVIEIFS